MYRVLLRTPSLCLVALCVFAQTAHAQEGRAKRLRVEVGHSSTHNSDTGFSGAIHFVTSIDDADLARLEAGLIGGNPYLGLDAGIELRFPQQAPVGLLLRAGGGLLGEDGFGGAYGRAGGGLELAVSRRLALRATWQAGVHGGQNGPDLLHFGFDYRWGETR